MLDTFRITPGYHIWDKLYSTADLGRNAPLQGSTGLVTRLGSRTPPSQEMW